MDMYKMKRAASGFMMLLFIAEILFSKTPVAFAQASGVEVELYNKPIAKGITYTEKQVYTSSGIKQRMNIITADMGDNDVNIIFSKAKDNVKKADTLSQQIQREIFKGNNVVAGMNADMFDMSSGFSTGPQVKEGAIIAGFNARSEEKIYPVFGIDSAKKPFIENIYMEAKLTAGGDTVDIFNINRESFKDNIIIITPQINEYKKIDFSSYASNGALTVVKGINGPIKLGTEYEGTVESMGFGSTGAKVPDDGIIIASNGAKLDWVKSHMKPGDKVKFKFDFSKKDIVEAIGTYAYLVKDGRALTTDEMIKNGASSAHVYTRKARSAVGITKDNRVIAITVDYGTPSAGISDGITFAEMANVMLNMGAVQAAALDGGGSTQMNVRLYGNTFVNVVNRPSDGRERAITNGILFVSNSPKTYEAGGIIVDRDITIFKNTSFQFKLKGTDTNLNPVNFNNSAIQWSVDGGIGKIDSKGNFTAGAVAGEGHVTASLGSAKGSAVVAVVDTVASLNLTDSGIINIEPGKTKQFYLDAKDSSGMPVIINNSAAKWTVTGNIGIINANGLLTASSKKGSGQVTAEVGGLKASVQVVVGQDSMVLDNFEHNDAARYKVDGYVGGVGNISSEQKISGKYSYKVTYDYSKSWTREYNGTINIRPTFEDKNGNDLTAGYTTYLRPKKLGMWVYGDAHAPWLRAVITDGDSNKRTLDIVQRINWRGWRYVDVDIPKDVPLPISLDYFYMVECDKDLNYKGTVYFDDIRFTYTDNEDFKGPGFYNFKPQGTVYSKNTLISLTIKDDKSGIDKRYIKARLDGKAVSASFNESTGVLTYNAKNLARGTHTFEVEAQDRNGNKSNPYFKGTFTVNLDKDTRSPDITNITPLDGSTVKIPSPRISFNIKDSHSGVDASGIYVYIDGRKAAPYYDVQSGWGYAVAESPLSKGTHTAVVYAKDKAGNVSEKKTVNFTVDPIKGPSNPQNYIVDFVSDSHDEGYGYEFYNAINNDGSELVIQNGDLVDSDSQSEWSEAKNETASIKNKSIMLNAGDREAYSGSLNNYIKYFGSPAYSFEFGNSLFISLNSSLKQSISASDPTQFDYLEKLLSKTGKQNIFIYTHVPTKDTFGTGHGMAAADASKLEKILGDYKKKNPSKNINVVFGHLHTNQSWNIGGVTYTIDGNGGNKRYVKPEQGGFLSYSKFIVNGSNVVHKIVPMADKISILDTLKDITGQIRLPSGTKKALNLYGDFTMLNADYIAPLSTFKDMDVKWESDNPQAVSVDQNGVITTIRPGVANITAYVSGKTASIKIMVVDQRDVIPAGLCITPAIINAAPKQSILLNLTAYDLYGSAFTVDSSLINWQIDSKIGTVKNGTFTAADIKENELTGTISAEFNGISTVSQVKIVKPVKKYATVTVSSLIVRDKPSPQGKELGKLAKGTKVEVLQEVNGWIKIDYKGKIGYISKQYTN